MAKYFRLGVFLVIGVILGYAWAFLAFTNPDHHPTKEACDRKYDRMFRADGTYWHTEKPPWRR